MTYHNIKNGSWCPKCRLGMKDIEDYKEICSDRGEYILDYIPENTTIKIPGWKCKCGDILNKSYNEASNCWCRKCGWNIKILEDYKEICKGMGNYVLDYIPKNTLIKIKGWKCGECSEIFESNYKKVNRKQWCPKCSQSKSEKTARKIMEELMEETFDSIYPKWLTTQINGRSSRLQLDGYNKDLKLAFEYQGEQHDRYIPFFHGRDQSYFLKQQERDQRKVKLCIENNVTLIIIPYIYDFSNPDKMKEFIYNSLIQTEHIVEF